MSNQYLIPKDLRFESTDAEGTVYEIEFKAGTFTAATFEELQATVQLEQAGLITAEAIAPAIKLKKSDLPAADSIEE